MPVAEPGNPPFGIGLNREQIAAVRLRLDDVLEYADAVAKSLHEYAEGLSEEEGEEQIALPFVAPVYPMLDSMSRTEVLSFHTAEHLGEVQYIKGLLGLHRRADAGALRSPSTVTPAASAFTSAVHLQTLYSRPAFHRTLSAGLVT